MNKRGKLPKLKSKELIRILRKCGFYRYSQNGSHLKLKHSMKKCTVIVPVSNKIIKTGTLIGIIKQAKMNKDEFLNLI